EELRKDSELKKQLEAERERIKKLEIQIAELKSFVEKLSENKNNKKLMKVAGQKEVDMLKESMTSLEKVVQSMLQQKEQVSMEYVSDLVKAMSDVQGITDELIEMGYTKLASPEIMSSDETYPTIGKEVITDTIPQEVMVPTSPTTFQTEPQTSPSVSTDELNGLGSITKPTISKKLINKKEDFLKLSSNIKESIKNIKNKIVRFSRKTNKR
ncbi:hypothetical protein LCGC14_2765470, partial [marine sediment metagenome]